MKKLRSIFCVALLLLAGTMMFVGCGPNTNNQTTITLAEAKTIIVNALAIDETEIKACTNWSDLFEDQQEYYPFPGQSSNPGQSTNDEIKDNNRNLLEKLEVVQIELTQANKTVNNQPLDSQTLNGLYSYSNGTFNKYAATIEDTDVSQTKTTISQYVNGASIFVKNGETIFSSTEDDTTVGNWASQVLQQSNMIFDTYCNELILMFTDTYFNSFYAQDVTKNTTENGFTLTLTSTTYGSSKVIVNFDSSSNILGATLDMSTTIPGQGTTNATMIVNKYSGEITEPQWVTEFKATNSDEN